MNGPAAGKLGIENGAQLVNKGANPALGRALGLIIKNIAGYKLGRNYMGTFGYPLCFTLAENGKESPWEPYHVERGFAQEDSTVTAGGTVTWNVAEEQQLRFGASKTIARPQFREQAPQVYLDPETDRSFIGNPFLFDSEIVNLDARYERYFDRGQFATIGVFYKNIDRPIESVVNESGGGLQQSFLNAPEAVVYGVEAEFKKFFEFETGQPWLDGVRWLAAANYTYTKAEVKVDDGDVVADEELLFVRIHGG